MPGRKREPATIWKLIDAQCIQLTDAVAAARVPFLLSLLWAFIWAWSLYSAEFGYLATFYRQRLDSSLSYLDATGFEALQFRIDCNRVTAGRWEDELKIDLPTDKQPALSPETKKKCEDALNKRRKWAEDTYLESTAMSFPGGFPKIEESDLGVIGQGGLLLILAWLFYALRRENHAIRSFVDIDKDTRTKGDRFPDTFILEPQEIFFSAEHLAYAYHAVSQRFVFIFQRFYRPLLRPTVLLVAFPAIVAALHVLTDCIDVKGYDWAQPLTIRLLAEVGMLICVWSVTVKIISFVLDSSILLNAWYLASKVVWIDEWDEATDDPASKVKVNLKEQTADPLISPPR